MKSYRKLVGLIGIIAACGTVPAYSQTSPPKAPPPLASTSLDSRVRAILSEIPNGSRYGLVITDEAGRTIISINPDARFVPASNTKMFTTAAAFTALPDINHPDIISGARVAIVQQAKKNNIYLTGLGDARLSSAADCTVNCLASLADAVAARTREVDDIIGDATAFADDRWSQGMSWNNIASWPGTAVAALMVDDNEVPLQITPGDTGSGPVNISHNGYFQITNRLKPAGTANADINYYRAPNSYSMLLWGRAKTKRTIRLGVDDPAHYAAWQLKRLLEERGVKVNGTLRSLYRQADGSGAAGPQGETLATLTPPPLSEDISRINKESQNLHAEMLLRRIGATQGNPSTKGGLAVIDQMLTKAGVPRNAYDFSDGSGMSTYNRVSPRAMIQFLRWTQTQPWGPQWKKSLAVAGTDGTLENRFKNAPLAGKLMAKTGALNQAAAISGFLPTAKGKTFTFAFYVNDIPQDASPRPQMDRVIELVAAEN